MIKLISHDLHQHWPVQKKNIYIYCNGVKNHTTRRSQINAPEGEFNEGFGDVGFSLSWVGDRCSPEDLCSCSPVAVLRAVLVLSSGCPPCRARVRGWPVKCCSLEYNADFRVSNLATVMSARDTRHTPPPQASSWVCGRMGKPGLGGE